MQVKVGTKVTKSDTHEIEDCNGVRAAGVKLSAAAAAYWIDG
jgi:hypothetical protein